MVDGAIILAIQKRGHFLEKRVKDGGHKALLDVDGAAGRWFSYPMIFTHDLLSVSYTYY